jgi:hypothetical protein
LWTGHPCEEQLEHATLTPAPASRQDPTVKSKSPSFIIHLDQPSDNPTNPARLPTTHLDFFVLPINSHRLDKNNLTVL